MNKVIFFGLFFISLIVFPAIAGAQNRLTVQPDTEDEQTNQPGKRPNLLQELDLTPAQIRQVRQINQDRKANQPAARARLKAANDELDRAMYADGDNEAEVEARRRDVEAAQSEVLRNRINYEQRLRRILTPQQLSRFRELRQQFNPNNKPPRNNSGNGLNKNSPENLNRRQRQQMRRMVNRQRLLNQ